MRNAIDFTSWHGLLSTLLGLVLVSLVAVGLRLFFMHAVQRRRERENRQINERLKTLIAAYKTLGGSFTGNLAVDPSHRRDLRGKTQDGDAPIPEPALAHDTANAAEAASDAGPPPGSDRRRRVRDAVEAALSDVILLGTEEQVQLAAQAASDMAAGRTVHTAALVVSLRGFIREVLDLEPIPAGLGIPSQGPSRTGGATGSAARGGRSDGAGGGRGGGGGSAGAGGAGGGGSEGSMASWTPHHESDIDHPART